jgi:hypothetical protein
VCHRSKYLIEVDAHLLHEATRGQASLVLDNLPYLVSLQLVHLLQGDGMVILRQFHELPGVIPLDEVNLLFHHDLPCRVLLRFSEGRWLPRAHQMQPALQVSRRPVPVQAGPYPGGCCRCGSERATLRALHPTYRHRSPTTSQAPTLAPLDDDAGMEIDAARGDARTIDRAEHPMFTAGELGGRGHVGLTSVAAPGTST